MKSFLLFWFLVLNCHALTRQQRRFPDEFIFGAATAAYQIEGGWNADDKGESTWDRMTHTWPNVTVDGKNGDVAANSYENYKRDVEMIRELGLDAYRFSISWSRLLPTGFSNKISEAGVKFYNNYIDEMLKYGITPMITLYHFDLPQKLQDLGGFANPLFTDWFEDYARVAYEQFGDRVKYWITFNEPQEVCYHVYGTVTSSPSRLNATGVGEYLCAKHLVLAHAKAYHAYNNDFKPSQGGECGITFSVAWFGPLSDSEEDEVAAELRRQFDWGLYAEPIFSEEGGFPKEALELVAKKSEEQGYPRSRFPDLSDEEKEFVRGSSDFIGVNHYTSYLIYANEKPTDVYIPSIYDDMNCPGSIQLAEWKHGASEWLYMAPDSLYNAIIHLHKKYNGKKFFITENGWSHRGSNCIEDDDRVQYYRAALENVLDLLDEGVNLKGYMAWSLMDNFEWTQGYTEHFGLYEVDFEDPARTRTPRKSAFVYKQIVKSHVIDYNYDPEIRVMTIDEGH